MPKGPFGFPRLTESGPFANSGASVIERDMNGSNGSDAIVVARISGEKSQKSGSVVADAVAQTTRTFPPSGQSHYMVSQAPVTIGQDFDHYLVAIHYPDTALSPSSAYKIEKNLRKRITGVEKVEIHRV